MSHLHQHQHHHQQSPNHPAESKDNNNPRQNGVMDFRNLCQRLDVDSLRAKLPALPPWKLPKSLPKIRGRKIFNRSSHENVNSQPQLPVATNNSLNVPAQGQQFINRTPQRISTISSLMQEVPEGGPQPLSTYRSAGSLDDDYYARSNTSRPISPIRVPEGAAAAAANPRASLTQRLQRGYKTLSEWRLKHVFSKQITVRRDGIEVDRYVEQYEAELKAEQRNQARRDREIAENYDIRVQTLIQSRQNTLDEEEELQSGDESGLEQDEQVRPRKKKPGIASSRFSKVRQPPLQMPQEEQQETPKVASASSNYREQLRQRLNSLPSLKRSSSKTQDNEASFMGIHLPRSLSRSKATPKEAETGLRHNIKRLRKSIKRPLKTTRQAPDAVVGDEEKAAPTLRARLSRSSDQLQQRWLKSFKSEAYLERTLNKLNERMHQMKFFQRQTVGRGVASPPHQPKPNTVGHEPNEIDDEELAGTYHHSDSDEDDDDDSGEDVCAEEAFDEEESTLSPIACTHSKREMGKMAEIQAKRSNTAWSSESLEELPTEDYPRVLIHQEHTDAFESTLIIAVSTKPPPIPPPPVATDWLPNEQILAGFQEQAWPAPALYKPKSIDIFEASSGAAFADFDEALRHAPVLRISAGSSWDSGEEADDSSSRVTRIRVQTPQIGNSRESLMAQEEEEELEEEHERPPSVSPPPPPLPQRRPPPQPSAIDTPPPPLPTSKPPPTPPAVTSSLPTQRSLSMSRPSKPLVKTSSLRLTYNEQMHPNDVGKVNKLINRFEGGRPRLPIRRLFSEEFYTKNNNNEAEEEEDDDPRLRTPIPEIITTQPNGEEKAEELLHQLHLDRQNSNCSRSEYGSPLAHASTPTTMPAPTTTALNRRQAPKRHGRRSLTRDDDNFYSFDSDEENSYYSISPAGSSRYVVEI